jgi:hypothetical protein
MRLIFRQEPKIVMNLPGGLGNQLFAYFAGRKYSDFLEYPLKLKLNKANGIFLRKFDTSKMHPHGDIRDFGLPGTFEFSRHNFLNRNPPSVLNKALRSLSKLIDPHRGKRRVSQKGIYQNEEVAKSITRIKMEHPKKSIELIGYFQNCEYAIEYIHKERNLFRWNPELSDFLISSNLLGPDPIFLHIRLRDYLDHGNMFGILSIEYFKSALDLIEKSKNTKIWIFTDDPIKARELLSELSYEMHFIEEQLPISLRDQVSVLQLMSKARALICSNSSYSIMAGLMSDENCSVYYPHPMFKDKTLAFANLPPSWHPIAPSWLQV